MNEWIPVKEKLPPERQSVLTKIDDEKYSRNEQCLIYYKNHWFFPDMSMYVYYTPTHWKEEG